LSTSNNPTTSPWRVVGASAVGTSHTKFGTPCQDAFDYQVLPTGVLLIALADGAGSANNAHEGSQLAVETAIKTINTQLQTDIPNSKAEWQTVIKYSFETTRTALIEHASTSQIPLREYATTLILVILTDKWSVGGLIGDCLAVTLNEEEELVVLCVPQKGEYANTTNFITQDNALDQLQIEAKADPEMGVAVFSDGLQSLAVNLVQNKPHAPFFTPLFAFTAAIKDDTSAEQQLAEFLNSDRVNERTDDDKTLVLARRV